MIVAELPAFDPCDMGQVPHQKHTAKILEGKFLDEFAQPALYSSRNIA